MAGALVELRIGTTEGTAAAGNDARLPTADEKTRLSDIQSASGATTGDKISSLVKGLNNNPTAFGVIGTPSGFSWTDHPLVGKLVYDRGKIRCDYDVRDNRPTGLRGYLSPSGSDSNDGLTAAAPKLTLASLISNTAIRVIKYAPGVYDSQVITTSGNYAFIGSATGKTIFTSSEKLSWSLEDGQTYTYKASRTYALKVLDFTRPIGEDLFLQYTLVESVAAVEATAGTWYYAANVVYVHTMDNAEPTNDTIRVLLNQDSFAYQRDDVSTLYFENIINFGGATTDAGIKIGYFANDAIVQTVYMYNVRSYLVGDDTATQGHGFSFVGCTSILEKCIASYNASDGFTYHGALGKFIEIDCEGSHNGNGTDDNDNGSSIHDAGKVIRVNGYYHHNEGPNVVDVGPGATESWNLGVTAYATTAHTVALQIKDMQFNAGNVLVWLDSCRAFGGASSLYIGNADDTCVAKTRNCVWEVAPEVGALSTLTEY